MAFAATLSALDLSGGRLALSLLGFNLGIEIMQLAVVLLVLPPLVILAHAPVHPKLVATAAVLTTVAAVGWLFDRVGITTFSAPQPTAWTRSRPTASAFCGWQAHLRKRNFCRSARSRSESLRDVQSG